MGHVLGGREVHEGRPLADREVVILVQRDGSQGETNPYGPRVANRVRTDAAGRFTLWPLPPGGYWVTTTSDTERAGDACWTPISVPGGEVTVDLRP